MTDAENQETQLAQRIERIRLPAIELARRAGLNQGTVSAGLSGKKAMTARTRRDIRRVVAEEELALLRHLVGLHPVTAGQVLAQAAPGLPGSAHDQGVAA